MCTIVKNICRWNFSYFESENWNWKNVAFCFSYDRKNLFINPISLGGGTLCPPTQWISCGSLVDAPKLLPLHDFVPLNLSQALLESFFGFIFQNFEKIDLEDTWSASILMRKLKKLKKIEFFCRKSYFFLLNLNSTWS